MGKLRVATGDGADAPLKYGTLKKVVLNAIGKLTKSAKGGGFLMDVHREVLKSLVVTDALRVRRRCSVDLLYFCREGIMGRKLRLDRSTVRYSTGRRKDTEHESTRMSYFYYISKPKKGPQMRKKAGPSKAPTSQGPRKDKRDQAGPALRQKDPGPSTSGLQRSNRGKSGKVGSMATSSGSMQGRPTMKPLIPWLSPRADRIARRRGLAPGGSGAVVNHRSVAPDTASDSGSVALLDRSKQGRGYGKEPAGSPVPPLIHSERGGTALTAASLSPAADTTPAANQIAQHEGGQGQLDEEETGEIANAQQPLSPLGNTLAALQREHKNVAALEEEVASIMAECADAETAVECAEREKKNILKEIGDSTESAEKLPQFTDGVELSQAAYEKTISGFRNAHMKARRLKTELASLREQETAKKVALGDELKKLGTKIEFLASRLQEEMVAAEASKRELDDCPMRSEKFDAIHKQFQKQWEIVKETRQEMSLKDNELTAAKTQAQATENALATSISTAEEDLDEAVSLYRDLTAQLLTGRARSLQSIGDPRVSTGAPSPGQSYGTPIQHEKLANDLFLQHEMETKAAKAAETLGKNLLEKRKALAAAEEKFAKTLERVKMYMGDLPPVPNLGTLAMEERSDIIRLMIAQEKAKTVVHLELDRLRTQLDEQEKANEKVLEKTKGRVDALRTKMQESRNDIQKLTADLCSTGDEDRSMEIGHRNCGKTAALVQAKTNLAAAEAELEVAGRDGENMAYKRTQRKIGDMESAFDRDETLLRELVARLYAGTKAGTGNAGCVQPVEPGAGGRTGTPRDGTETVGPDAGRYPVVSGNLEEDAGNVGTDAGMDPAGTRSGNTQDGASEVGSDAEEMEQVETPTRDGSVEPATPGSVGLRSEGSLSPSPRGGHDNHEQADLSSTEDPDVPYYPSTYNYDDDYDDYEYDFFALLPHDDPQDLMEEDGGPGPSCSGLGDRSPSTGIARLDADAGCSPAEEDDGPSGSGLGDRSPSAGIARLGADAGCSPAEEDDGPSGSGLGDRSPSAGIARLGADAGSSTTGAPGIASASLGSQDGPEEMDTE